MSQPLTTLRVALIAGPSGPIAAQLLELEGLLIQQPQVRLTRFENARRFIDAMWQLDDPVPHFAVISAEPQSDSGHDQPALDGGLDCLENLRQLESGRLLPTILIAAQWTAEMLVQARKHQAASCIGLPDDPIERLEVLTQLVRYWCAINEPAQQ